jgi:hypothetical protein
VLSPDFSKISTAELRRRLHWQENDNGTTTMEEELRRMFLIQEINAEIERRA